MLLKIGVDRLGGHEEQGHLLGLAGNEILVGDVADMDRQIPPHPRHGLGPGLLALGGAKRRKAFERKLGVDGEPARVVGQAHQAVGPAAVRERRLELEGAGGEPVADDRLHPPLAIGAAGLLVGEDVLQPHHLAREVGELALRRVDHGQPLVEARQVLGLPVPALVDALGEHAGELALPRAEHLHHGLHAPGELGLKPGELRHPIVHLPRPLRRDGGLLAQLAAGAQEKDREARQQHDRDPAAEQGRVDGGDGVAEEDEEGRRHA
jgi:hypothetical protein